MGQHQSNPEVPFDFVELVVEETLHQGMFDDFLKGGLPETLEQSHLGGVSLHHVPLEDLGVVHGDVILVQGYSFVQMFLVLLHRPGNILHHGSQDASLLDVQRVQLGSLRDQEANILRSDL